MVDYDHRCLNLGVGKMVILECHSFEAFINSNPTERKLLGYMVAAPNILPRADRDAITLIEEEW